ncbi:TPA: hypothetical protein ACXE54_005778 [Klebsiella michiganensis]|uniref:hypothetical protein n=1 Tax=Klebsiella TaxID=570 RepID=UPI0011E479B1|nr:MULTISPECIES: hypothetical protein [Klebsiella]MBX8832314.1 hypothetical protein [Klebsiella michiganensis]MBX8850502.1 hypothetical protein [Klebsiella michiganensis]MBX8870671.1 hypothetical protein [Klebsiella michiganensis]MBZ7625200.1 hypothetical protein [Klebsiella michiganensis]MDU3358441.1 hypothetical protein [Klebsiella sp.]
MTTDITELAQREKFEAWWERKYKHLESSKYTDAVPHIKYGFWMAYQAGGAELVEALEKAQAGEKQWREVVDAFCTDDADWHNLTNSNNELIALLSQALCEQADRIAELEPFRTAYMEWGDKTDWVQTDKRFGVVKPLGKHRADVLKEYIQHLESRTVKLTRAVSKGGQGYQEQVERILTAAGIKWEAE